MSLLNLVHLRRFMVIHSFFFAVIDTTVDVMVLELLLVDGGDTWCFVGVRECARSGQLKTITLRNCT